MIRSAHDASPVVPMTTPSARYACAKNALCAALDSPYDAFAVALEKSDRDDVATIYGFADAWAGKIQVNSGDWNAIADLPKLQALLLRIAAIDPRYDHGGAYLYLGVINSIRPASLGGKPEEGRAYFDKALELSAARTRWCGYCTRSSTRGWCSIRPCTTNCSMKQSLPIRLRRG